MARVFDLQRHVKTVFLNWVNVEEMPQLDCKRQLEKYRVDVIEV